MNKNTILITFLLLISSLTVKSQDTSSTGNASVFSIGAYITPTFSYRTMKALEESGKTFVDMANDNDMPTLLFELGGRANLMLGNRLRLTAGAMYSQKGYQSKKELKDTITGETVNHDVRGYTTYNFLEVPVLMSFAVSKDSSRAFYIVGGISNGFLMKRIHQEPFYNSVSKELYFPDEEDVISEEEDFAARGYNTYQLAYIVGLEGNFMISDKVSLMVQPHFKQFITPVQTKDSGIGKLVQGNLFSVGFSFGMDYHF